MECNRLQGVAWKKFDKNSGSSLKLQMEHHAKVGFLFVVKDIEVHGDGATIWPRFQIVGAGTVKPGPLELHFFRRISSEVRVIGFHLEGQRRDKNQIEFRHDALNDFEDRVTKTMV